MGIKSWWEAELSCGGSEEWSDDPGLETGDEYQCDDHGLVSIIRIRKMPRAQTVGAEQRD